MPNALEAMACTPIPVEPIGFNSSAVIPYRLSIEQIRRAMSDFVDVLGFLNQQLSTKDLPRIETLFMLASFSTFVSETMTIFVPRHCPSLVKNRYHNGYPDLLPKGHFPADAVQHGGEGIEVKGSRNLRGWQGHNPEEGWLMVFVFDANGLNDEARDVPPQPFRFLQVLAAPLKPEDWSFSGRSETSRRTITASVTKSGYEKMSGNWIYQDPEFKSRRG